MATDVEVTNFQSIEHAKIVVQGYTALVGRSNIGKSALVRAVKAALTGAAGTAFVRHGSTCARRVKDAKKCQCKATVRIKREGFDLLWEKGDHDNRYTFNGKVYDSAERGTPSFLTEGYAPIKIGDDKEVLQVADQFDPIFLLNRTGGVIADVLSDVAHLDRVNGAMRLVEKDRREATGVRKVREQDVVDLTQRLIGFDGLDQALARVFALEEKIGGIDRGEKRLRQVERFLENAVARATEVKRLSGVEGVTVPSITDSQSLATRLQRLTGWYDRLVALKTWWERVKPVEGLIPPSCEPLKAAFASFGTINGLTTRLGAIERDVERLEASVQAAADEAHKVKAEWDALGVCPTCEQLWSGHAEPLLETV